MVLLWPTDILVANKFAADEDSKIVPSVTHPRWLEGPTFWARLHQEIQRGSGIATPGMATPGIATSYGGT